eukprot:TRINITY_DN6006_c0_g1_i1.p1 TRINITY_DN6006_c0_g1~~TRINITY_DN6006_c0_g1_i1.p1  ORF type:complete len:155 (+),score=15.41 TRINITY_DN6006_c0_g1_i1:55-519(+)
MMTMMAQRSREGVKVVGVAVIVILILMTMTMLASSADAFMEGLTMKVHGNYCGLNYGDATYQQEPIDGLDRACYMHDQCYDAHYLDCRCDADMLQAMKGLGRNKAIEGSVNLISGWFENSSCSCLLKSGKRINLSTHATPENKAKCSRVEFKLK